jgi:hypothetical protein
MFSETSVNIYQNTRHHVREDSNHDLALNFVKYASHKNVSSESCNRIEIRMLYYEPTF